MASADDLFRAWHDVLRLPIGPDEELVYEPLGRGAHLLSAARLRLLLGCRGLATLDEHASRIAARSGAVPSAVRAELTALRDAGLLVSATHLLRRIADLQPDASEPPPRIALLAIPTRDRGPEAHAALESYLGNARDHGRTVEYLLAEGDVSASTRAATRATLAELSARYGATIFHAGFPERAAYAQALAARVGVDPDLTRFALLNPDGFPQDTGASRNTILLHGVGDLLVQVDDDTRCRLATAPGAVPGLSLTSQNDPTESWFPGEDQPALPDRVAVPQCYVAAHEELLGRNVAACAEAARRQGLDLERATATLFRRLSPSGGRVIHTMTGNAGDTGTGSMWHYLLFTGKNRERLHLSEDHYRRAFTGRQAVRVVPRASVSDGIFCMAMSLGIDARGPLPPFLPVQRNSDGLFGLILRLTHHGSFTGFLPWVIEHSPARLRTSPFADFFAGLGRTNSEDMLGSLIAVSNVEATVGDPCQGLRTLGLTLARWGRLPLDDFEDLVRIQQMRARALDVQILDESRSAHRGSPAYWARDVERTAKLVRAALTRPELAYPLDLTEAFGVEGGRAAMQRMVRRYGELLQCWPELLAAARALREEGVRPGVRV